MRDGQGRPRFVEDEFRSFCAAASWPGASRDFGARFARPSGSRSVSMPRRYTSDPPIRSDGEFVQQVVAPSPWAQEVRFSFRQD